MTKEEILYKLSEILVREYFNNSNTTLNNLKRIIEENKK